MITSTKCVQTYALCVSVFYTFAVTNVITTEDINEKLERNYDATMDQQHSPKNTSFKPVTHIIFDLDGLLLDTVGCYHKIDEAILGKYQKRVPEELHTQLAGLTDQDCARKIIEICNLPITTEEYEVELKKHTYLLRNVTVLPGAERLIRHLASNNIPIAIATSSSSHSVDIKLTDHQKLFSLFHHMVMGSTDPEVKHGKPAPDIFLICADRFPDKPKPEQCLVFEDAPSGVLAARNAGMQVVLVPDGALEEEDKKNATLVLDSLLHFMPEDFGLPPMNQ